MEVLAPFEMKRLFLCGELGCFENVTVPFGEKKNAQMACCSEAIPRDEVKSEVRPQRPLSGLPPARRPSQSHTHHTLCMALFLVPKLGSACLLLLTPLQNWDPSSTKGLQEGCHSHPQNATAGLPSYGLVWGEGAIPWVAMTRSPFPFGFSYSGSHLVPTLGFQRMDSGPCLAVCPL